MTRIIRIPRSAAASLGGVRSILRILAWSCDSWIWLKVDSLSEDEERRLRQIPGAEWFQLHENNELIPLGKRLPQGYLPTADWQRLVECVIPELTCESQPKIELPRQAMRLVPDDQVRPAVALLAQLEALALYAESAPLIRLSKLRFAANNRGKVLIIGTPLLPLRGTPYWDAGGIFVPSGFTWSPAIEVDLFRDMLQLRETQRALFHANFVWETIDQDCLVMVSRSAVRSTWEKFLHARI